MLSVNEHIKISIGEHVTSSVQAMDQSVYGKTRYFALDEQVLLNSSRAKYLVFPYTGCIITPAVDTSIVDYIKGIKGNPIPHTDAL